MKTADAGDGDKTQLASHLKIRRTSILFIRK